MKKYHSTMLVVDDDSNDLHLIEAAFRQIGVTDPIHTVSGGQQAIDYMMGDGKYVDRTLYPYPTFPAEEALPFSKDRSPLNPDFMKRTFHLFVDRLRSAPWIWALSAIAVAALVVFTNALTLVLSLVISLVIGVLILNGLYHVLLSVRGFLVGSFAALAAGIRAIISTVLPG